MLTEKHGGTHKNSHSKALAGLCVCVCVFCPYSAHHTKTKTTLARRTNTHLHPKPKRRRSCGRLNGGQSFSPSSSPCFDFFLSSFSQRQAALYNRSAIGVLYTETSLCSVWGTVGVNSVNHRECCHSEGSRGTFTVEQMARARCGAVRALYSHTLTPRGMAAALTASSVPTRSVRKESLHEKNNNNTMLNYDGSCIRFTTF